MQSSEPSAFAGTYFARLERVLQGTSVDEVGRLLGVLARAHEEKRTVFIAGNGGSAATASHMANDLVWGLARTGIRPFRAIALTDNVALMTAIANDEAYRAIFSRQLEALAQPGDVLVAITGSGNSENILRALEVARALGLTTVGILGMGGGRARALVDVAVVVPSDDYGPIEDVHMVLDHLALEYLRATLART